MSVVGWSQISFWQVNLSPFTISVRRRDRFLLPNASIHLYSSGDVGLAIQVNGRGTWPIQVENVTPKAGGSGGWGRNGLSPSSSCSILASPRIRSRAFRLSEHFCVSGSTMPIPHWNVRPLTTCVRCQDPPQAQNLRGFFLSVGFGP